MGITPASGLSRIYSRATDSLGNQETTDFDYGKRVFPLFDGTILGDAVLPVVTLSTDATFATPVMVGLVENIGSTGAKQ